MKQIFFDLYKLKSFILVLLICAIVQLCQADSYSKHGLFWSGIPQSNSVISQNGAWQTISGSNVTINLEAPNTLVLSYEAMVQSFRKSTLASLTPRDGHTDTLQVRCLIDGVPYRFSSGYVSDYAVEKSTFNKISTVFAVNLTASTHVLTMQWKKLGNNVEKWMIFSGSNTAGFSIVAQGDLRHVYALQEFDDNYIYQINVWKPLSKNLTITLKEDNYVTVSYSITIQPQLGSIIKDNTMEYLTTRALIDGAAFTESSETFGSNPWNPTATSFRGAIRLKLKAGIHTVSLQWKKMGHIFKSWGSSPSIIDGFASSRNVIISVDKYDSPVLYGYDRHIVTPKDGWTMVNKNMLQFFLTKLSTVLITYALPVTQYGNPNFDRTLWDHFTQAQSRVLVDGIPYTVTGGVTVTAEARRFEDMFVQLPLILPAGSHSISLQWKANANVPWTTLNDLDDGFAHSDRLLTFITSENAIPTITAPERLTGWEDSTISITSIAIDDVDIVLQPGLMMNLNLTFAHPNITFPNALKTANPIHYYQHSVTNETIIVFKDTVSNINKALYGMIYNPGLLWFGNTTLQIVLSDLGGIEQLKPSIVSKATMLQIQPVDHMFVLTIPDTVTANFISSNATLIPMNIEDLDPVNPLYRLNMSVTCGTLGVNVSSYHLTTITILKGALMYSNDIALTVRFQDLKIILHNIYYFPQMTCNTRVQKDIFTFGLQNTETPSQVIGKHILVDTVREVIPPKIVTVEYPQWNIGGISVYESFSDQNKLFSPNETSSQYSVLYLPSLQTQAEFDFDKAKTGLSLKPPRVDTFTMSSLTLLSSDYMKYTVEMKYNPFVTTLVSSSYVGVDQANYVVIKTSIPIDATGNSLFCALPERKFPGQLIGSNIVQCTITFTNADITIPEHDVVFIKVVWQTETMKQMESNYLPLYAVAKLDIQSISPSVIFPNSQSLLQIAVNTPQFVRYCTIGKKVVEASLVNGQVFCRIPTDFYNASAPVSTVDVSVATDSFFVSNIVTINVLSNIIVQSVEIVESDLSGQYIAVYKGDWPEEALSAVESIYCLYDEYSFAPMFVADKQIYCELKLGSSEIQSCCDSMSCTAGLKLDLYDTNTVNATCRSKLIPSRNLAIDQLPEVALANIDLLETGYVKFYVADGTDVYDWRCKYGESLSHIVQETNTTVSCILPDGVSAHSVDIVQTDGSLVFTANIDVDKIPTFVSALPSNGPVTGGNTIALVSENTLPLGNYWCLFGDTVVAGVLSQDMTLICSAPPHLPAVISVSVLLNNIFCHSKGLLQYSYDNVITIKSIEPMIGYTTGGSVIVRGSGFDLLDANATVCSFAESTSIVTYINDTHLSCAAPPIQAQNVDATFTIASKDRIEINQQLVYRYLSPFVLRTITPSHVFPADYTQRVIIVGQGFDPSLLSSCFFGDTRSSWTSVINNTHVECDIPPHSYGDVAVTVQVDNIPPQLVSNGSATVKFTYYSMVRAVDVQPQVAFYNSPIAFTLTGAGFLSQDYFECWLDEVRGSVQYVNENTLQCSLVVTTTVESCELNLFVNRVPVNFTGINLITLRNAPIISSIFPSIGLTEGGEVVQVKGLHFESIFDRSLSGSSSLFCRFGTYLTPTLYQPQYQAVSCLSPKLNEPSVVSFGLLYDGIDLMQSDLHTFTFVNPISVTFVSPLAGPSCGGQVITIRGFSFNPSIPVICEFDETKVVSRWVNTSAVECLTPAHASGNSRMNFNIDGYNNNFNQFVYTFTDIPSVTSLEPSTGYALGNTLLTVFGERFHLSETYYCYFDSVRTSAYYVNETVIKCPTPSLLPGKYKFSLTTHDVSGVGSDELFFSVLGYALLNDVLPADGSVKGGELITLIGEHFDQLKYEEGGLRCKFGNIFTKASILNNFTVTCLSPPFDYPQSVTLSLYDNNEILTFNSVSFNYVDDLLIRDFFPKRSGIIGGDVITISGLGLNRRDLRCFFDDISVTPFIHNDTAISCESPVHQAASVPFGVQVGNNSYLGNSIFVFESPPIVLSAQPQIVLNSKEQTISITGDFDSITEPASCIIGQSITPAVVLNANKISCSVQTVKAGDFNVSLQVGQSVYSTNSNVMILNPVTVQHISPATVYGSIPTKLSIIGRGFQQTALNCRFGVNLVEAVTVNDTLLFCTSPLLSEVELQISFGLCLRNSQDCIIFNNISIANPIQVIGKSSRTGSGVDGFSLKLFGYDFPSDQVVQCIVGDVLVAARVLSSTAVECYAWYQFEDSSLRYGLFVNEKYYLGPNRLTITSSIEVNSLSSSTCSSDGGCSIEVYGSGFYATDDIFCQFGYSLTAALYISNTTISCVAPSNVPGEAEFAVLFDGAVAKLTASEIKFTYAANGGILRIEPAVNWKSSSSDILVIGENFESTNSYQCLFDKIAITATVENSISLRCSVPSYNGTDLIKVQVLSGKVPISSSFTLQYLDEIFIESVTKKTTLNSENVLVHANYIPLNVPIECCDNVLCNTGHIISLKAVACPVGMKYLSFGGLAVSVQNPYKKISNVASQIIAIATLQPNIVFTVPGTVLEIFGKGFLEADNLVCVFDDLVATPIIVTDDRHGNCITPSLLIGNSVVSIQDSEYVTYQNFTLQVIDLPELSYMFISTVEDKPITTIIGSGFFENMGSLSCKYEDSTLVPIIYVTNTSATCNLNFPQSLNEFKVSIVANRVLEVFSQSLTKLHEITSTNSWIVSPLAISANSETVINIGSKFTLFTDSWSCIWMNQTSEAILLNENLLQCIISTNNIGAMDLMLKSGDSIVEIATITVMPKFQILDQEISVFNEELLLISSQLSSSILKNSQIDLLCRFLDVEYPAIVRDNYAFSTIPKTSFCLGGDFQLHSYDDHVSSDIWTVKYLPELCSGNVLAKLSPEYLNFNDSKLLSLSGILDMKAKEAIKSSDSNKMENLFLFDYDESNYPSVAQEPHRKSSLIPSVLFNMDECWMNKRNCYDSDAEISNAASKIEDILFLETAQNETSSGSKGSLIMDSVYPRMISSSNGTWITVTGRNFDYDTKCVVSGRNILNTVVSSSKLLACLVPPIQNMSQMHSVQFETVFPVTLMQSDGSTSTTAVPIWHDTVFNAIFKTSGSAIASSTSNTTTSTFPLLDMYAKNSTLCFSSLGCESKVDVLNSENHIRRELFNMTLAKLRDNKVAKKLNDSLHGNISIDAIPDMQYKEASSASIYMMSKKSFVYPCVENCYLEFVGYNLFINRPWCIRVQSSLKHSTPNIFSCAVEQNSDKLICPLPDNSTLLVGKNIVNVLAQCEDAIEEYQIDVSLFSSSLKNITFSDIANANNYPIVQRIGPSQGWVSRDTTITLFGKYLSSNVVTACVFSFDNKESFTVPVLAQAPNVMDFLQCRVPNIQQAQKVPIQVKTVNGEIIATNHFFEYQNEPIVEHVQFSEDDNSTIVLIGNGFLPFKLQQVFCKVLYYHTAQATILFGRILSDQFMQCLDVPYQKDLQLRGISISFNGFDFFNEKVFDSKSADGQFLEPDENWFFGNGVMIHPVSFIGNMTSAKPNMTLLNPSSVTINCNQRNYIPFALQSYQNKYHYHCILNERDIGSSTLQTGTQTVCVVDALWPGLHKLQLVAQEEKKLLANMEVMLYCLPNPQVESISLQPQDELFFTSILLTGANFQNSMEILCHIDHLIVKAMIDNTHRIVCSFYQLLPGKRTLEVIYQDKILLSKMLCLNDEIIQNGNNLVDDSSSTCEPIDSKHSDSLSTMLPVVEYKIRSIYPANGLTYGETLVTIIADRSSRYPSIICQFGANEVDALVLSDDYILCRAPPSLPGNVVVQLISGDRMTKWCCGSYIYYPIVVLESIDPILVDEFGGSIVNLNVPNMPPGAEHVFCHVNGKAIFASAVNATRYSCRLPALFTSIANVSIGSVEEEWSNQLPLTVTKHSQMFTMNPLSGATSGNSTISIMLPNELQLVNDNSWCLFGEKIVQATVQSSRKVTCVSPGMPVEGAVMVQIQDGPDNNSPTYFVGMFSYKFPAEVLSVSPIFFQHDRTLQIFVAGNYYMDTNTLSCVFNQKYWSAAKWLSKSLLTCWIDALWTINESKLTVQISNNGLDLSPTVRYLTATEQVIIQDYLPHEGFDLGGDSIIIKFQFPLHHQLYCQFEGIKSIAVAVSSDTVVCITPRQQPGPYNITIIDGNGNIFDTLSFIFHKVPSLVLRNTSAVVRGADSHLSFTSANVLPSNLVGRISTSIGEILDGNCHNLDEFKFVCEDILTTTIDSVVYLDLTANNDLFEPRVQAIQVFTATRIVWNDPLYAMTTGKNMIQFGVDKLQVGSSILCHFVLNDQVITETAIRYDETIVQCNVPTVDNSPDPNIVISLQQFGNTIFGPQSMEVIQLPDVSSIDPKILTMGKPEIIVIQFNEAIPIYPAASVLFQNQVFLLTIVNATTAISYIQSTAAAVDEPLYLIYEDLHYFKQHIGGITSYDMFTDLSLKYEPLARTIAKNYTITSKSCILSDKFWCKLDSSECRYIYESNCQSLVTLTTSSRNPQELLAVYPDHLWVSPVFVYPIDVLPVMSVIATRPNAGSTNGNVLVSVFGNGFSNDASLQCSFGGKSSSALYVNDTLILCQLPSNVPGRVPVNIYRRGIQVSRSIAMIEYIPIFSNITIHPNTISSLGTTNVTVSIPLRDHYSSYTCRFNQKYVPTSYLNGSYVLCVAPSFDISEVEFAIALDSADITVPYKLAVRRPLHPILVDPIVMFTNIPTNITIVFDEIIPWSADITCLIDDHHVPTVSLTSEIICVSEGLPDGAHKISLISDDVIMYTDEVTTRSPFDIESVHPRTAFSSQSVAVEVVATQISPGDDYSICCFGEHRFPAIFLSFNRWQCYTPVIASDGGLHPIRKLPVGLAKSEGFCEYSGYEVTLLPKLTFTNQSISSELIFGGSSLKVEFIPKIPLPLDSILCRIGTSVTIGQYLVDDSSFICVTDATPEGKVSIDVSINGLDFIQTGLYFEYKQPVHVNITHFQGPVPVIFYLNEYRFPSSVPLSVNVFGEYFREDSICVLDETLHLVTHFVSYREIRCDLPVHLPGNSTVRVLNTLDNKLSNFFNIQYVSTPSVPDHGIVVEPTFGPRLGYTIIKVSLENFDFADQDWRCWIGEEWSFAFNMTTTSMMCTVPPSPAVSGLVPVRIANLNKDLLVGAGFFQYIDDPMVYDITPKRGTYETELVVIGNGFSKFPFLYLELKHNVIPCQTLSNVRLLCRIPQLPADTYNVMVQTNGQHLVRSGAIFEYFDPVELVSLWPLNGPALRGNTMLSITISPIPNSVDLYCLIDTAMVPAEIVSSSLVRCRTMSHRPGIVTVSLLSDGIPIHDPAKSLQFAYVPDISVDAIMPDNGYTAGEFPIFVSGSNFINSTALGCMFANMKSRAIYLNKYTLLCLSPSPLGRPLFANLSNIPVEVTVNGLDYSESNILFNYSQPCDQGFFCPGMTRQLCPNGTYCPINSRNFTLCPPGTFQPMQGQIDCVVCPVGYICPDLGMPRPVICPPGLICDTMGLRASTKLCPAGYYCLNGTKASTVDEFLGKREWVQDYVTGVVSFNSSVIDWAYHDWPAPAVGRSRPQFPPSASCDGLVCDGGTTAVLAEAPFPCPIGHFCRAGAGNQIPMPKNFSSPQRCFDGFFCPRGSVSPEGSGPCPNGFFCPTQLDAIICPPGHYCPGVGNRDPIECYPGTYNPYKGQANCTVCPTGHICPGWGLLLPEPCPAGFVCLSQGLSYPVILCPQGYRCDEGTLTLDPSDTTKLKPKVCKNGEFCLGGVSTKTRVEWIPSQAFGVTHPQTCSEGTYCQAGAYLSSGSGLCFKGHYCPPNSTFPTVTPLGNFAAALGSVAATLCYPGTYAPLVAQVNCQVCPSGHSCISYGTYIPTICLQGTYRMQVDSVTCMQCPTGTYSYETGSPDLSLCMPCPKGRICGVKQMTGLNNSVSCPAGYICGYGTDRSSQFSHLTPGGYYTTVDTIPELQFSKPCLAGYYCPRGTPDNQQYSGKCTVGSYCPKATPNAVTHDILCPMVTTSATQSSVVQNCHVSEINVCDKLPIDPTKPMEDITYYGTFSYMTLDDSKELTIFDSSLSAANPTGELQVVKKIYPVNISASSNPWLNDTIEAFRACPLYGSGDGGDIITVIGRNFRDTKLNYCKFRACINSNLGEHPRRCRNQVNQPNGDNLPKIGNFSQQSYISRARFISTTRMECTVPEFLFDYDDFHPTLADNKYDCRFLDAWGGSNTLGNYSYVRPCYDLTDCLNRPETGLEFFNSLTLPCTTGEVLRGVCSHMPEENYMINPCMSGEVAVEVTNDGEHYTGGIELGGTTIPSTVRYSDGRIVYQNYKNYTTNSTFAVYTYVYPHYFYQNNTDIMKMERRYCSLPRYSEEGERERENGWFKLNLNELAQLQFDFTHLPSNLVYDEHFRIAIFALPSRCTYQLCNSLRVRLSPAQVAPCNNPMPLSYWFEQTNVPKNVMNNITVYALDDMIFKVEIQILYGLFAAYTPLFENSLKVTIKGPEHARSFKGLGLDQTETRQLSQYISFEERRISMQYFFVAVIYQDDAVEPPLNLPPLYSDFSHGRALIMNSVDPANNQIPLVLDPITNLVPGVQFWLMPATTPDESKELLDAYFETFHGTKYLGILGYSFEFNTLVLPYFPYFSNCYVYDSYVPIWALLEDYDNCALPDGYGAWTRYNLPPLLDQDDVRFVGPFDFFYEPYADYCMNSLTCNYEEDLSTTTGRNRWFEQSTGSSVYQMIRYPVNYMQFTGRGSTHIAKGDGGGQLYVEELKFISGDNFIPVTMDHTLGDTIVGCVTQCFARSYTLSIVYYQVDNYNKRIVAINMIGAGYDFKQKRKDYTVTVSIAPLGFLELILNFAFPLSIFIVIFIFVGFVNVFFGSFGWLVCRVCTVLQNPPKLRMWGMLALIVPPPIAGVTLAVMPIWFLTSIGNYYVNGLFITDPNAPVIALIGTTTLDGYPMTYNGLGGQLTTAQQELSRYGRIGSVFAIVGLFCMFIGAKMFLPREESKREREVAKKRTSLAEKEDLWNPVLWQKLNLIFSSFVVATLCVLIVEISYWTLYGTFFYQVIVCLTIFSEMAEMVMARQLNDALLVAPLACAWAFIASLITFGAPDFYSFLISNFFGYVVANFQRVFQDTYVDTLSEMVGMGFKQFLYILRAVLPKYLQHPSMFTAIAEVDEEGKDYRKRAVEGVEENGEDNECVEPILEYFNAVSGDTIIVYYFPYLVYLLMQYRIPIQLPVLYGIRQSDMMIYLVYQLFQIIFQPVLDILNHAQCELFHGWKIYEYLVYARYRFIQREARWKGLEITLDECIEESLRRVDQMCFSSQYFLMVTMQMSGILYMVLAYEVWLRWGYSPFSDSGFFLLFAMLFAVFTGMRWVILWLAVKLKVWKIKHENTSWHLAQKDEDDLDVPAWEEIKGASTEAFLMNQRITSDTFRYKFLNYNRTWLINQLPQILTPRTLRRSRPYLINQFARIINARRDDISSDSDEKEKEQKFGAVSLSTASRNIVRHWLGKARRRMKLRELVEPLIKRSRGAQCESCLSRKQLQIEYEVELDNMMKMYDNSYPGEDEVDQVQWKQFWINNQRYHTICLACLTKRKEIEARNKMKGGGIFDPTLFDDDTQEAYPDWGPIFLSGPSKAILLNWYRKAQKLRAGKRRQPRQKKQREVKDISDDEGDEDPMFSWLREGLKEITPASKAIAVKWMRTARARLQQRRGKGTSTREQDEAAAEAENDVTEQFKSGKKSKNFKK